MTFDNLPENWSDLPLDTPGLAPDVVDLVLSERERAAGCLAVLITRADLTLAQPCVVNGVGDDARPEEVRHFFTELALLAAEAGGALVFVRGRDGSVRFTDSDRRWHQVVIDGCRDGRAPLLGAYLATPGTVRAYPAPLLATGTDGI